MVEFEIRIHPEHRIAYIPKEIAKALGSNVKAVANRTAVLFYPKNVAIEDVVKSLEIIHADLKHAITLTKEKETSKKPEENNPHTRMDQNLRNIKAAGEKVQSLWQD